ncbi:MAG: GAF domain-containing protein [Lachnospiraceae bacterium]|nr:GAF domain-containing protein [Lachnospiraceae bacterium]
MSKTDYKLIAAQIRALAEEEPFYVPLLSNVSALLFESLPDVSWAGFYLKRGEELVLGPFQGKPACIHIAFGKGVCGTSFSEDRPVRVENVHLFPGHIACDAASNSEIVLPIHANGETIGVLDLDSTVFSRFSEEDEEGLQLVVKAIEEGIQKP